MNTRLPATRRQLLAYLPSFALLFLLAATAAAGPTKSADQRAPGSASRKFIMFCSRDSGSSSVGHAFILFGDAPQGDEKGPVVITRGAGFYPDPNASTADLVLLKAVPGVVLNDYLGGKIDASQCRLVVRVEESVYAAQLKFVDQYSGQKYRLDNSTCVTMVTKLAGNLHLQIPTGPLAALPQVYTRRLAEMNGEPVDLDTPRPVKLP